MAEELEPPDNVYGFGSWLLWMLATRATDLVDQVYAAGPARESRHYGRVDGHPVPTPSLVAWLLAAAEFGLPPDGLAQRDPELDERQKVLRTTVSRAVGGEPHLFKDGWLHNLADMCGLDGAELDFLIRNRDDYGDPVEPEALRKAITQTFRSGLAGRRRGPAGGSPAPDTHASGAAAATRTLPRDIASFTGRTKELRRLATGAGSGMVAGLHVIGGMAGVGKTAFAVHAAHQLAGRFPDGQIFLPLHGHTPGRRPVDPADALASLLLTAGIDAAQIPPGLEARSGLWRDRLAGKRLILVLDDAADSEQVRPLLPGTPGSLVLITSRRHLTALDDTRAVSLDILPPDEAAALIARLADRPGLDASDPAVAEIARLCGYLPLAVGMLARQLHHHPAWTPSDLAADLAAARDRLELMTAENLSVAVAFDLSYQDLTQDQQRLFRRLGLHPGTDIDAWAAAAIDDTDLASARRHLQALYDQHLIAEPAHGRYRMHDLIGEHARTLAATEPPADRDAAMGRLLDYYLHTARAVHHHLARRLRHAMPAVTASPPAHAPEFATREDAVCWMDAERLNLHAVASYAAGHGRPGYAVAIPAAMNAFLRTRGHWDQGLSLQHAALAAARRSGDEQAQSRALGDLGILQHMAADLPSAAASQAKALELCGSIGDRPGEADALFHLGWVQYLTDDYPAATASLTQALGLYHDLGDQTGEADALTHLGYLQYVADDYPAATASLIQALELCRADGDRTGEASALYSLATVQRQTGYYPAATASLSRALELCRADGDWKAEADILTSLSWLQCLTGKLSAATANLTTALEQYHARGNRLGEAAALNYLGLVQCLTGDYPAAIASEEQALELYRALGSRLGQGNACQQLGVAQQLTGDFPAAAVSQERALELYRAVGDRLGEAETLNNIGDLALAASGPDEAQACHEQALAITGDMTAPMEEARALEGIGRCHLHNDRPADADAALRQALAIYQRLGSPGFQRVETILRDHQL